MIVRRHKCVQRKLNRAPQRKWKYRTSVRSIPSRPHHPPAPPQMAEESLMIRGRVREPVQRLRLSASRQRHQQLVRTHLNSAKIGLVRVGLLGLGCASGSPTLSPLRPSLNTQADKASDSPRPGRRGRGAYLPDRLGSCFPASAQIGLRRRTQITLRVVLHPKPA